MKTAYYFNEESVKTTDDLIRWSRNAFTRRILVCSNLMTLEKPERRWRIYLHKEVDRVESHELVVGVLDATDEIQPRVPLVDELELLPLDDVAGLLNRGAVACLS